MALCLGIISTSQAAADETFITDIYIAVPSVGGEIDGEFVYQSYYSEDGFVLVPKKAFSKNDVIALDDKIEGAKGLKAAINKSIIAANKEFSKAGVTFEVRNIYFVSAENKDIKGSYKSDLGFFDLGVTGDKSTLLTGFEKLTASKTDSFNILLAPLTEGDSKIEEGWAEQPGNTSILDIGRSVNQKDGGFILLHELGHNLGLGHQTGASPFNTAMAPQSPSRPPGKETKIAKPTLSASEISTIKANVKKGSYNNYKKPKKVKSTTQTSQATRAGHSVGYLAALDAGVLTRSPEEVMANLFTPPRSTVAPATPAATPAEPADSSWVFNTGIDVGQLDRGSVGILGTDDGGTISPSNLFFLTNEELIFLYKLDLIHQFVFGASVWDLNFGLTHGSSDTDQRIDFLPVGAGNNLLIFSPQGQSGGLGGGLNAGARDAENIRYSNEIKLGEYRLGLRTTIADIAGWNIKAGPIFSYGHQDITEKIDGEVVGLNQTFMYRSMAEIMTYSVGGRVDIERGLGTVFGKPAEFYIGASLEAQFQDNDGYSALTLDGVINAFERQGLGGSETTPRAELSAGISFDLGNNTELSFGGSYRHYDTARIDLAPQEAARIEYDGSDEYTGYARIKFSFGPPVHDSPILNGAFHSDRRLKRDIAHLITLDNGIKLYAFKYLWDDQAHVGVMAQDLLRHETYRYAVVMRPNGFYAVNYAVLGLTMATLEEWNETGLASVRLTSASQTGAGTLSAASAQ